MERQSVNWYRRKAAGTLDHEPLLTMANLEGYRTQDPAEALYWYLNKRGYNNSSLARLIGVSEGTIRYWLSKYSLTYPEFCCKVRMIGYDSPQQFIGDCLSKNFSMQEMGLRIGVSPSRLKDYMEVYYEREDHG
jgi:hypothetical protein